MKYEQQIENILFRPILFQTNAGQQLGIIFGYETRTSKTIGITGQPNVIDVYLLNIIDIHKTIETGIPAIEISKVDNFPKFFKHIVIPEKGQFLEEISTARFILQQYLEGIVEEVHQVTCALNSIGLQTKDNSESNLVIATPNGGLAHIVYNTIGKNNNLKEDDIARIGNVIKDVVISHLQSDIDDDETVEKIKHEIEFKIIEAMPVKMRAGEININMDFIVNEIQDMRGQLNDTESDEE